MASPLHRAINLLTYKQVAGRGKQRKGVEGERGAVGRVGQRLVPAYGQPSRNPLAFQRQGWNHHEEALPVGATLSS